MEQPPHPASGNSLNEARPSGGQDTGAPASSTDFSTLETITTPSALPANPNLGSATLAVLARRYDILGEAGRGAMGQVYKARDRETGEVIALKLLKPEIASDPGMVERFKSELLFARRITHKNVCRVYEFNRIEGIAYTSMEFVDGESLRSVLKRFGSLTPRTGIDFALQMCAGLKEAHAQGIVHRDLKPENVMIDARGNVKVMDFGIARSMEAMTLLTGSMVGTPAYMAPEQAMGKTVDYRADIYALGLVMYEMFTGTQPFHADNAVALALKHMQEYPRSPREIESSISHAIEASILRCLEKDPQCRFQSISDLETALRSQLPESDASRFPTMAAAATSSGTLGATAVRSPVATNAPAPLKTRHAGLVVGLLVAAIVASGAAMLWRNRPLRDAPEKAALVSSNVPSVVPDVVVAAAPKEIMGVAEPAKPATPAVPKPKKVSTATHVDPSVASSTTTNSIPPVSAPVAPIADKTELAVAELASAGTATPSSQNISATPVTSDEQPIRLGGGYVWVNRFAREGAAQNAAKRIEKIGLSVTIIPRHRVADNTDFFVVLTGPYPPGKIDGIVAQLKANGFSFAKPNRAMAAARSSSDSPLTAPAP